MVPMAMMIICGLMREEAARNAIPALTGNPAPTRPITSGTVPIVHSGETDPRTALATIRNDGLPWRRFGINIPECL
jgi:hypothetical protein